MAQLHYRTKRIRVARPTPGTGDHNDPDWLLENISLDQIESILATTLSAINSEKSRMVRVLEGGRGFETIRPLFNERETDMILSLNEQYETKTLRGYYDRPLTGKQLYYLHKFYARVAADTAALLIQGDR